MPHIQKTHSIKSEIKENLSISFPLITSQLIYSSSSFIGTAMIAHLGEDQLAASVLVSSIWWTLSVLFFGILNSTSVLVAHQYGAKNYKGISDIMGQSFILGALITIILIAILSTMPLLLRFTNQPPDVLKYSYDYMISILWTIPGLVILVIIEHFLAGINRTKMVLRISILVVPIEIPIIYILIFGKFGFPKCGIAGIGYGFAITYTLTSIFLVSYLLRSKQYQPFAIFKNIFTLHKSYLKELIVIGLPMGMMHIIEVSTFAVATLWISKFGTTTLAAHQIVLQYLGLAITIVFAMSQAVTVRVGHEVGRQDLSGVRYASFVGMMLNAVCIIVIAILFYLIPDVFIRLDLDLSKPENFGLAKEAASLLWIGGVLMIFDNFRINGFGALRGLKDTRIPMYSSLLGFWVVGLSLSYLFAFPLHLSAAGVWWGLTIGIASAAIVINLRLYALLQRVDLSKIIAKKEVIHH